MSVLGRVEFLRDCRSGNGRYHNGFFFFFTNFCSRKRKPKRYFSHEKKAKRMLPAGRKISSGFFFFRILYTFLIPFGKFVFVTQRNCVATEQRH